MRPTLMRQLTAWICVFLLTSLSAPAVEAATFPSFPGADPLALARAHHFYNQGQYDKALSELSRIAEATQHHPDIIATMNRVMTAAMIDERHTKAWEEEQYQGKLSLAISNIALPFGEEPYSDEPAVKVTQTTVYGLKHLTGEPRNSNDKAGSHYFKMETQAGEYKLDASVHYEYFNGPDDNARIRHANYRIKGPLGTFNLGDSSVYFSRYVLSGVDYTGVSAILDLPWTKLELLMGQTPFFRPSGGDDKYIYPRYILGFRNEYFLNPNWLAGQSVAYLRDDPSRLRALSNLNGSRENLVVGFDNDIDLIPGLLKLYHETVFTDTDPDTTADVGKRKDFAHYFKSEFSLRNLKILTIAEYVGPDFESGGGYSSFQTVDGANSFLRQNGISNDRFHYETSVTYTPKRWLYTNLQWSRTRNKLGAIQSIFPTSRDLFVRDSVPEHTREDLWQANMRVDLPYGLPRLGARFSELEVFSSPGSVDRSSDSVTQQLRLNLSKQVFGTYLDTRYEFESFVDESGLFNDELRNRIGMTASHYFRNRVSILGGYSYMRRDETTPAKASQRMEEDHEANISVSSMLKWGASGTVAYTYNENDDFDATVTDTQAHRLNFSLSWPWIGKLFGEQEIMIDPFFSYHKDLASSSSADRDALSLMIEASYKLLPDVLLTLSTDYRMDDINGDPVNGTGEELRIFMSMRTELDRTPADMRREDEHYRGHWDEYFGLSAWRDSTTGF